MSFCKGEKGKMFTKCRKNIDGREALVISGLGPYSLTDTVECGQAFCFEAVRIEDGYAEYIAPIGDVIVNVAQRSRGELIFFDLNDEVFDSTVARYFSLDTDLDAIANGLSEKYDSEWFRAAAECARGIAILRQDPWETLFSFIVSQNNNIPRIKKILKRERLLYGENLAEKNGLHACPLSLHSEKPSSDACKECGACYSFPSAAAVASEPEKLLPSKPGFRYRYLVDAAERVADGRTQLDKIADMHSYEKSLDELKKITGVGDKVASCVALFGLGNLDAFPVDVWMKRAIDTYFDGKLDPRVFGEYAGVAQQYIFHYVRNVENAN